MRVQLALCLTLASVLFGCASQERPAGNSDFQSSRLRTGAYVQQYGTVDSPELQSYLNYLTTRLTANLDDHPPFTVTLLNTRQQLAYSAGEGQILLSRGLVAATMSEAQLAFVLAHEMSHQLLRHTRDLSREYTLEDLTPLHRRLESEADASAIQLLTLAGYDPRSASEAIFNVYQAAGVARKAATHPDVEERVRSIFFKIASSGWQPPGTTDRREFRKFRATLLSLS